METGRSFPHIKFLTFLAEDYGKELNCNPKSLRPPRIEDYKMSSTFLHNPPLSNSLLELWIGIKLSPVIFIFRRIDDSV